MGIETGEFYLNYVGCKVDGRELIFCSSMSGFI